MYSYLSGLCGNRYESSCKKLLAECISAVLAGFIGMYLAEYKDMNESLRAAWFLFSAPIAGLLLRFQKSVE
ncbi:hypothetical protein [Escherichia coli]|uniref:hypothetical protein n=1 Tax=Escherichia coli TaxID=562 RepID=UPI00202171A0|nr:hypothetical protein [Escherichia coli]